MRCTGQPRLMQCFQLPTKKVAALIFAVLGLFITSQATLSLFSTYKDCLRSIGLLMKDQIIFCLETKYKYYHIINLICLLSSLLTCNLPSSNARFIYLKHLLFSICHSSCPF